MAVDMQLLMVKASMHKRARMLNFPGGKIKY